MRHREHHAGLSAIRGLFTRPRGFYDTADLVLAKQVGVLMFSLLSLSFAILAALVPPTAAMGSAGWALAGAIVASWLWIAARWWRHSERVGPGEMLVAAYLLLAEAGVLHWLAGGGSSPYKTFGLLALAHVAATHSPGRWFGFLGVTAMAVAGLLVIESASAAAVAENLGALMAWATLTGCMKAWTEAERLAIAGLRADGDAAEELARMDPLTGLANRRAFDEAVDAQVAFARRHRRPLAIALFDANDFKTINDTAGMRAGDAVLRDLGAAINGSSRRADGVYRWGGDEFAVLLPDTDADGARAAAGHIACQVAERCERPDGGPVTVKFAATALVAGMGADDLLAAADEAMLRLKRGPAVVAGAAA